MGDRFADWNRDWSLIGAFISPQAIEEIERDLGRMSFDRLVYCSFENRFVRSGGLGSVAMNTLPYLREVNGFKVACLFTPFYPHLMRADVLEPVEPPLIVVFARRAVQVEILKHVVSYEKPVRGEVTEYFLRAPGFFEVSNPLNDPYRYVAGDRDANDAELRRNALFFCKAVPAAMLATGMHHDVVVHAQDWHTTLLAFTVKMAMAQGALRRCAVVQTMHNAFDSYIPAAELAQLTETHEKSIGAVLQDGASAYQIGLRLVDAPLVTVSDSFARELTSDPMQTGHFAPHLQDAFAHGGVFGIANGPFVPFSKAFPRRARSSPDQVRAIKSRTRAALLRFLETHHPEERFGRLAWGREPISRLPDSVPILTMSGRLDPMQKGFDIFLQAIERFARDEIKVILTPLPIVADDLDYFHQVASKCDGNVTVIPVRLDAGRREIIQSGASYGVMPSLFEPFGAAIEYMVNGTVVVARATGGLIDQIDDGATGFLFRESPGDCTLEQIRDFNAAHAIPQWRKRNSWAIAMARALESRLRDACALFRDRPDAYHEMICDGFARAERFSWSTNARLYGEVYAQVRKHARPAPPHS